MADFRFEIYETFGVLSESEEWWTKELYGLTEEKIAIVEGKALTVWLFYR